MGSKMLSLRTPALKSSDSGPPEAELEADLAVSLLGKCFLGRNCSLCHDSWQVRKNEDPTKCNMFNPRPSTHRIFFSAKWLVGTISMATREACGHANDRHGLVDVKVLDTCRRNGRQIQPSRKKPQHRPNMSQLRKKQQ